MTYNSFYNQWHHLACFSTAQVKAIHPDFPRGNYLRWQKAGYIVPLRQGWYAFADYVNKPDYAFLKQRHGIESEEQLRAQLQETVAHTDLKTKQRDFEHLLFEPRKSEQILHFLEILGIA